MTEKTPRCSSLLPEPSLAMTAAAAAHPPPKAGELLGLAKPGRAESQPQREDGGLCHYHSRVLRVSAKGTELRSVGSLSGLPWPPPKWAESARWPGGVEPPALQAPHTLRH